MLTASTALSTGIVPTAQGVLNVTTTVFAEPAQADNPAGIRLSEAAAKKVQFLLSQEDQSDDLRLRIAVQPGGCSGLRYQLFFDDNSTDGDKVSTYHGFEVVVDRMSVPYLTGATVDFADRIDAQGFTIDNPNAKGSCACGDSFH
ncbi:MAG: iron-sulfur cluster assembly accessory protein [Dactylosporangium sp.]|nr:iron-sulfur cluster assembly accessory protein [Dactylosporangium sp.]NNJ61863.1 iron-sulfur cluster assembly accessory protein [Dactylosporangium sp.]